jgi:hypothetical protein
MPTVHVLYRRTPYLNRPVGRLRLDILARVLREVEEKGAFRWRDAREDLVESSFAGEHAWTFFGGVGARAIMPTPGAPGRRTLWSKRLHCLQLRSNTWGNSGQPPILPSFTMSIRNLSCTIAVFQAHWTTSSDSGPLSSVGGVPHWLTPISAASGASMVSSSLTMPQL